MRSLLALVLVPMLFAPQEDWLEEMKRMNSDVTQIQGPLYLLRTLRQEMQRATKALDDSRLDLADRHLLRLAHMSRPYNDRHADRVVAIAFALRAEVRAEGAALVLAVADDLKLGRIKEAEARIDLALASAYLATTHRAEFERLKEWLKKPPEPAAVEVELARWRALMPPGRTINPCAPCGDTGETDCQACLTGATEQSCRACTGKGEAPCGVCRGQGKIAHGGFGGSMVLLVDKEFKAWVIHKGKKRRATFAAQRISWNFKACTGTGRCLLQTTTTPLDPNKPAGDSATIAFTCNELYDQLKLYVFNGSARMFKGDQDKKANILPPEEAKRFFAEYEKCSDGHTACDACGGGGLAKCGPCTGNGVRLMLCADCGGSAMTSCAACRATGDSAWVTEKVPVSRVPALGGCLDSHVKALHGWQEKRARERLKGGQARDRLVEAARGLDPRFDLNADRVKISCVKCAAREKQREKCEACWGSGFVEFDANTPTYNLYANLRKLQDQVAQLSKASHGVSSDEIQLHIADTAVDSDFKMPPGAAIEPPKPPKGGKTPGIGGKIKDLPAELRDALAKADESHEEGKKAIEASNKAGEDNEKRRTEALKARDCFRQAAEIYGKTQETLDEWGLDTPQELVDKVNTNLQALWMARKMAF